MPPTSVGSAGDVPRRRTFLSALIHEVRVARHTEGVASNLTRFIETR
jgi:hypothetical protein